MEYTEPAIADLQLLAKQVLLVTNLATDLDLPEPDGTEADLPIIQSILDSGELDADDTYELQALGVVFGRALASAVDGLDWAIINDEHGSDPTLRYRNTTLCLNVLTALSKRVEDGETIDVQALFTGMRELLDEAILKMGGTA